MSQRIDAIFVNGVFRPETPVDVTDGQRVSLNIEPLSTPADDLSDVRDLLDVVPRWIARAKLLADHRGETADGREDIAEIVNDGTDLVASIANVVAVAGTPGFLSLRQGK